MVARLGCLPFSIDWLPDGRLLTTTDNGLVVGADLVPHGAAGQPFNEIVVDVHARAWVDMPGAPPGAPPAAGTVSVLEPDGTTLYIVANQWGDDGASEGVVLTQQVDVARAGRP